MHVLEAFEHLVNDVLLVDVLQDVGSDHSMQVCIHEIKHKVNISVVFCSNYILQPDDVFVAGQLLEENDLSESPLRIGSILKGVEVFLKGNDVLGLLVDCFPHYTICSLAYKKVNLSNKKL